ncbi:MAG TPA: GYD domain-containing protein [Candidatus Sulfotelmatobacter sp.]|nr:GYD domain-containing protein [Candidatus Sulfotelmatobacter sp.]
MPHFLHQVAYSQEGWQALLEHPQNRIEAVRPAIEKLGGKIHTAWFAFGEYDVIVISELPDNLSAAAIAMAFGGGGACKSVQTTPLISAEEAVQALHKAKQSGYRPATESGSSRAA